MKPINLDRIVAIFRQSIDKYHILDDVHQADCNPYALESLEHLCFHKNWIDTVQWHQEDLIRDPNIAPIHALEIKRKIDQLNQQRTDMVEQLDSIYYRFFEYVSVDESAALNTESPAWAIDRLSILCLKIYHMHIEANRTDSEEEQRSLCQYKLDILNEQLLDLTAAIAQLFEDYASGKRKMKVYRQMKMYNDPTLNPVLYKKD